MWAILADFENTDFPSRLVRVAKIPQELPHPPNNFRSKADVG